MTIYDIKEAIVKKKPYYFSPDTLKFFGQSIRDFHVKKSSTGKTYIYAPSYWKSFETHKMELMGFTVAEFTGDDLNSIPVDGTDFRNKEQVLNWIKEQ